MKLNNETLKNRAEWETKGYRLPEYDRAAMIARTRANPTWLHFGAGNIFKALHGMAAQRLLNEGVLDTGIIAVERMDRGGDKFDDLAVVVQRGQLNARDHANAVAFPDDLGADGACLAIPVRDRDRFPTAVFCERNDVLDAHGAVRQTGVAM